MKKIFLGIFIAIVLFFSVWGIHYATSPINAVDAVAETVEHFVNDENAIIIREEEIYYSDMDGTLYNNASEGERVANNSLISTIFSGQISDDNLKELRTLDKKIAHRREKLSESTIYSSDGGDVESKIAGIIRDIAPTGEKNDVIRISDYKEDLNNLRSGVEISDEDMLESLIFEKEAIENRISTSKSEIVTGMSGIFTTYIDGMETALSPENMGSYTIDYIRNLGTAESRKLAEKTVAKGDAVCKVVNNHVWYAAMAVPTEEIDKHSIGENVTLRFNSIAGAMLDGVIYSIAENDENGSKLVIVKCSTYFEGAISFRNTNMDIIFESYSGFKAPVHAIRSDDNGNQYVIGMVGSKEYNCYCEVLYTDTDNEFIIIDSLPGAENNLDKMERIVVGER